MRYLLFNFSVLSSVMVMVLGFFSSSAAYADSHYPAKKILDIGAAQGNYGSCAAEAMAQAIEYAFLQRGMNVDLSNHYLFRYLWRDSTNMGPIKGALTYNDSDKLILRSAGALVPAYMYPEDGELINERLTGKIPHINEISIVHPKWDAVAKKHHFKINPYTFQTQPNGKDYGNTTNLDTLKKNIKANVAISLNLHSELLSSSFFNNQTGLLHRPQEVKESPETKSSYSFKNLSDVIAKSESDILNANHSVAVIGFDDEFYKGWGLKSSGAFFIRNSWNGPNLIRLCNDHRGCNTTVLDDLEKFRGKVASTQTPGLYAIPYDLVVDYISYVQNATPKAQHGIGGFRTYSVDYLAYYNDYTHFSQFYKTQYMPFTCNVEKTYETGQKTQTIKRFKRYLKQRYEARGKDSSHEGSSQEGSSQEGSSQEGSEKYQRELHQYRQRILRQTQVRRFMDSSSLDFQVAKIPVLKGEEGGDAILKSFLSHGLVDYYCGKSTEKLGDITVQHRIFPDAEFWESTLNKDLLEYFELDPTGAHTWFAFYEFLENFNYDQSYKEGV